jgi:enamine deaminase RidA (YjgF/YER057c/UK114 family)
MAMYGLRLALLGALLMIGTGLAGAAEPTLKFYRQQGSQLPFSPAVRLGDVIYLSGHIGVQRDGKIPEGIAAQTAAALDRMSESLAQAGGTMDDVFKCTAMLANIAEWDEFNKVYVKYFKPDRMPARSAFAAAGLVRGAALELECMAYVPAKAAPAR